MPSNTYQQISVDGGAAVHAGDQFIEQQINQTICKMQLVLRFCLRTDISFIVTGAVTRPYSTASLCTELEWLKQVAKDIYRNIGSLKNTLIRNSVKEPLPQLQEFVSDLLINTDELNLRLPWTTYNREMEEDVLGQLFMLQYSIQRYKGEILQLRDTSCILVAIRDRDPKRFISSRFRFVYHEAWLSRLKNQMKEVIASLNS